MSVSRFMVASLLMIGVNSAFVAAQVTNGGISGVVTDASGAAVPDAAVDVRNVATNVSQHLTTDAQGRYSAIDLLIGDYEVDAKKDGFQAVTHKGITLSVAEHAIVDFSLLVGQQQQTVVVEGQASQVETTSSTVSSLVDQEQIRELPLNGRDVQQLIYLAPGVQQITSQSQTALLGKSGALWSVSGSRTDGQVFLLDDQNLANILGYAQSIGANITGTSLGADAIAEFQTLTNTYGAQFGGNGAAVNAVSKSGTNSFHGTAFDFLRNSALDARRFFDPAQIPAFRRNQFGGSLGGPVIRNKAFFFVNYEGIRQALGETMIATVPDAAHRIPTATNPATGAAISSVLSLYPYPNPSLAANPSAGTGQVAEVDTQVAHEDYVLGRLDYTLSDKDTLFVREISDRAQLFEPFSYSPIPLWNDNSYTRNQFVTLEERRIISPALLNSVRLSFSRPTQATNTNGNIPALDFFPGSGRGNGDILISGLSSLGPAPTNPFQLVQNKFIEGDDVLWTHGTHSMRFGISVTREDTNTDFGTKGGTSWSFSSLTNLLAGNAATVTGTPAGPGYSPYRDLREIQILPYFQDEWRVTPKLTLNLGIRYEFVTNPVDPQNNLFMILNQPFGTGFTNVPHPFMNGNPSLLNFDPRVGVAYDPFGDHKTSIRAGFGIFHDLIEPYMYLASIWTLPPWQAFQQTNPAFPIPFSSITPVPYVGSPGWNPTVNTTPYMMQWNFTLQHEFKGFLLTAGYVGSRGLHMLILNDLNPACNTLYNATCLTGSGSAYGSGVAAPPGVFETLNAAGTSLVPNQRINPIFGPLNNPLPAATSSYNGLHVELNHRLSRNFQVQVADTYSHCIDDGSVNSLTLNNSGNNQDPYSLRADRGNCAFDVRNALRINGLVSLPFRGNKFVEGWKISGIETVSSGLPLTVADGIDLVGDQLGSRPNYVLGCTDLVLGTTARWFNPACFSPQKLGTFGDLGRTNVPGPNLATLDLALLKNTKIREKLDLQFRAEFFNVLNRTNLGLPNLSLYTLGSNGSGNLASTAGQITTMSTTPRQIQFALKLSF